MTPDNCMCVEQQMLDPQQIGENSTPFREGDSRLFGPMCLLILN